MSGAVEVLEKGPPRAARTLADMRSAARISLADPRVWQTARRIISRVTARDEVSQARAIRAWIAKNFRFVKDPVGMELLESPAYQLEQFDRVGYIQGDCDDAASLAAALLLSIGIPATFAAVDIVGTPRGFDHVFTWGHPFDRSRGGRVAMEFDTTRPRDVRHVRFKAGALRLPV